MKSSSVPWTGAAIAFAGCIAFAQAPAGKPAVAGSAVAAEAIIKGERQRKSAASSARGVVNSRYR